MAQSDRDIKEIEMIVGIVFLYILLLAVIYISEAKKG